MGSKRGEAGEVLGTAGAGTSFIWRLRLATCPTNTPFSTGSRALPSISPENTPDCQLARDDAALTCVAQGRPKPATLLRGKRVALILVSVVGCSCPFPCSSTAPVVSSRTKHVSVRCSTTTARVPRWLLSSAQILTESPAWGGK